MAKGYSPETMLFCRAEFQKIFIADQQIWALCQAFAGSFLPDGPTAAPIICDRIESALRQKISLSILRVGNAEGNALSITKESISPPQLQTFYAQFMTQNGIEVPVQDAVSFCQEVRSALMSADVIGFRSFRFDERKAIEDAIRRDHAYVALGFLYAREFLQNGFSGRYLHGKIITSAWIHLDILPYFDRILDGSESIIVITGRSELENGFSSRLGSRLKDFILVPVQGSVPSSPACSHFYEAFPEVRERLRQDLRGTLVLVGAGLFGKVYCHCAKMNGAVAVDLGSAFDVIAGLETRPIHKAYNFSAMRWVQPKL
jgi:GT-D fold-like domain